MAPSNIFICYRRDDTAPYAGRLEQDLRQRFVDHEVFMDLKIDLGEDFVERVERAIGSCAVLLVLIGPDWLHVSDDDGRHRLADPKDLVRLEIAMALERSVVVIPLLLRGARMPRADDLPGPLAPLVRRTGLSMRDDRWDDDVGHLVKTLKQRLAGFAPTAPFRAPLPAAPPLAVGPTTDGPAPELEAASQQTKTVISRRSLRIAVIVVILVLGVSAASFAVFGGDDPPVVRVGAVYSLSGADAAFGKDVLAGAQLAVDYINGDEGRRANVPTMAGRGLPHLHGAKIELVVKDFKGDRCDVRPKFNELVDGEHVAAVIGAGQSTYTLRAVGAADARKDHVPLVNDISSAPTLTAHLAARPSSTRGGKPCSNETGRRPSPWFFRVGINDELAAREFFKLIDAANSGHAGRIRKVAILHESNDIFGSGGAAVTQGLAKRRGLRARLFKYHTVLSTSGAHEQLSCDDPEERNVVKQIRTQVASIKSYDPDVVFALSYEPDAVAMVQAMQSIPYNPPLLAFGSGFATSTFIPNAELPNTSCGLPGTVPSRIVVRTAASAGATSALAATIKRDWARHHHNTPMNSRSVGGFMAMLTLAQAIDDAGSADPDRIQTALRYLRIPADATIMPWGVKFDTDGDNTKARVQLQTVEIAPRPIDPTDRQAASKFFGP